MRPVVGRAAVLSVRLCAGDMDLFCHIPTQASCWADPEGVDVRLWVQRLGYDFSRPRVSPRGLRANRDRRVGEQANELASSVEQLHE